MMGSGKTTVGRILSDVLSYSFFDRFVVMLLVKNFFSSQNSYGVRRPDSSHILCNPFQRLLNSVRKK